MSREPNYQRAFYDILRAMEIMVSSLSGDEVVGYDVPDHSHIAIAQNPSARAMEHLRSAADLAALDDFMFEYIPFGAAHEGSPSTGKATGGDGT